MPENYNGKRADAIKILVGMVKVSNIGHSGFGGTGYRIDLTSPRWCGMAARFCDQRGASGFVGR